MRKTNLFYLKDGKSNFLTFSNYGEYLTGVCLSTNHKIFPSSFICFNLPFYENRKIVENDEKYKKYNDEKYKIDNFKKFLMCYYENKLALLRDAKQKNNEGFEELSELSYLLEAIYLFFDDQNINIQPTYFGDIVEHDYNGTYNDSICIVDFKNYNNLQIKWPEELNCEEGNEENLTLYGWTSEELNDIYYPIYDKKYEDNDGKYKYEYNDDKKISITYLKGEVNNISFNCIIPLFNITNINSEENNDTIDNSEFNLEDNYKNIPYGIWISPNSIELHKYDSNISQSWSLVISSKFAPYPLGVTINDNENDINGGNNVDNIEKYTYAELLSEQSKILNEFNKSNENLNILSLKINDLTSRIQNLEMLNSSINNGYQIMDDVNKSLNENSKNSQQAIENLKNKIDDILNRLKWISN